MPRASRRRRLKAIKTEERRRKQCGQQQSSNNIQSAKPTVVVSRPLAVPPVINAPPQVADVPLSKNTIANAPVSPVPPAEKKRFWKRFFKKT